MIRGKNKSSSLHIEQVDMTAGYVGNGAADLTLSTTLSVSDNFDSFALTGNTTATGSRVSTGLFTVTMKDFPPTVLEIIPTIYNSSGTHLRVAMRSFSVAAKTITFEVRDLSSSDAVADPTSNDHIRLKIVGRDSTV